jgi:hypothetical protein
MTNANDDKLDPMPRMPLRGDISISLLPDAFSLPYEKVLGEEYAGGTEGPTVLRAGRDALNDAYGVMANLLDAKKALAATLPPVDTRGLGTGDSLKVVAQAKARPLPRANELIAVADAAFKSATVKHDSAVKVISRIGAEMSTEIDRLCSPKDTDTAKAIALHAEIRAHVKSLPEKQRHGFVAAAIKNGDLETAHAVTTALPFLSGLKDTSSLRTQAFERFTPELHRQRIAVNKALTNLQNARRVFEADYAKALPRVSTKQTAVDDALSTFKKRSA